MDLTLLHALNGFAFRHDGFEDPVTLYESASQALFLALVVVLGAGLALAVAQVLSRLVDRPRPFVADPSGVHLFASHAADASFPSDHATRDRRLGAVVLAFAFVLAAGRVAVGVHYPSDVLVGALLGAGASPAVHAALRCAPLRNGATAQ